MIRPWLCALVLAGCQTEAEPVGQVLLYVDTDAPVARGSAPGLVDHVRFEVLRGGVLVPNGTRDFLVDEEQFRTRRVSIGLVPERGVDDLAVRIRLFRDDRARSSEPGVGVTIETVVRIPSVDTTGIEEVTAFLSADDFGRRADVTAPRMPSAGPPAASRVSTWQHAAPTTCADPPRDEETCVDGGALFFGDPATRGRTAANDISEERLVVLSPFYIDRAEVTVAELRRAWPSLAGHTTPPVARTSDAGTREGWCTWRDDPSVDTPLEELPVNCVSWDTARAYCASVGKDLPTEAHYEYVMSGMGREHAYPWGNEEPACGWAVWGTAGSGFYALSTGDCRSATNVGVARPGTTSRDRVEVGGRAVVDLGGNVGEWARDRWSRGDEPFWRSLTPMFDPIADLATSADGDRRPVRGGAWNLSPVNCRAANRFQNAPSDRVPGIGFRCARAARAVPR